MSTITANTCYTTSDGRNFGTDKWGAQSHQENLNRAAERARYDAQVRAEAARIVERDRLAREQAERDRQARAYQVQVEAERQARIRRDAAVRAEIDNSRMRQYCNAKSDGIVGLRAALLDMTTGVDGRPYTYGEADRAARVAFDHQKTFIAHLSPVVALKKSLGITANKVNSAGRC